MSEKFDYYTIQRQRNGDVIAYGWDVYPHNSVLAGQERKVYLNRFDTEEQARAIPEYADANWSSPMTERQISVNHLSDGNDMEDYEMECLRREQESGDY